MQQTNSVWRIPVNLRSVLIAGETCNLFTSCSGHLPFKTLSEEQYSEFKVPMPQSLQNILSQCQGQKQALAVVCPFDLAHSKTYI